MINYIKYLFICYFKLAKEMYIATINLFKEIKEFGKNSTK